MADRRSLLALLALAVLATAAQAAASDARYLDINPWSWLPGRSTKSASVMDYFFPPSRTPKVSNEFDRKPAFSTTDSAKEFLSTDTPPESRQDARATTRKGASTNKIKQTTPTKPSLSTTPKIKNSIKTSSATAATKPVQRVTSPKPLSTVRKNVTATTSSPISESTKPHKHYTIYPSSSLIIKGQATAGIFAPLSSSITKTPVKILNYTDSTTIYTTLPEMAASTLNEKSTETDITETMLYGNDASVSSTVVSGLRMTTHKSGGQKATTPSMDSTTSKMNVNATEELDSREGYYQLRDKAPTQTNVKINDQTKKETVPLPAGSTSVLAKPTKYHYYPHNQHIYLLPECAIQQVCNAIYVRLNYTQPLCACPSRYRDPCSASLNADDMHTTRLTTDSKKKYAHKAVTLVKTCEAVSEMRECRAPRDWSLLALQNIRTGKSHYLVICRCPENHILEGPMSHDQPTYASVPGIRVYGMMCVRPSGVQLAPTSAYNSKYTVSSVQATTAGYKVDYSQPHFNQELPMYNRFPSHSYLGPNAYFNRMSRKMRSKRHIRDKDSPPFPWEKVWELIQALEWDKQ